MTSYADALKYLSELRQLGIKPGTERLSEVLHRLGNPQERYLCVHIAGTNGKGSTAAFCASLLLHAASRHKSPPPRIGLYTSPHLCRVTERLQVSDENSAPEPRLREAKRDELAAAISAVQSAASAAPPVELTFFEVLTAAAFVFFEEQQVEVAVIETGLGGRLDATRLCRASVTVVTSIDFDHMELLGPTLSAIAFEKAGIFRPGVPALAACDDDAARRVLRSVAAEVGAPLWLCDHRGEPDAQPLSPLPLHLRSSLSLQGAHQHRNAALAVAAVIRLPHPLAELAQDLKVQAAALRTARWPGRLERLWPPDAATRWEPQAARIAERVGALPPAASEVWIDAAHNPEGAHALGRFLDDKRAERPLFILCGVVAGKKAAEMTEPLHAAARIFLTRPPSPRGLSAEALRAELGLPATAPVSQEDDWQAALRQAITDLPEGGLLCIYGSIFLIGAVRALWLGEKMDPPWLQDPAAKRD